jgi:hypothetical protein
MRIPNGHEKEQYLFQKFRQLTLRTFPRRTEDWETLFDMQHYWIPTRLMDWSENLGIAAFFASSAAKFHAPTDAAIYILNPITLNEYSGIKRVPFIPDDPDLKYRSIYWDKKPFAPTYPIAIEPIFSNERILAQRGVFTVHGDNTSPIHELCPKAVKRIVLKSNCIPEVLEFLEIANINESTVFPDASGIADFILRSAGLK